MGGTRTPGPEGLRGPDAAIEDGTLARQRAVSPGSAGSKGGHTKQAGRVDEREMFLDEIRQALPGTTVAAGRVPGQTLMTAFFGSPYVTGRLASGQCSIFHRYANLYYVHIYEVNPTGDVRYPGGICDGWRDLTTRPRNAGRNIIDCEGYAYLASVLFRAAGWTVDGYRLAHVRDDPTDFHIVAQITLGEAHAWVGGPDPTTTSFFNECRHVFGETPFSRLEEVFPTQEEAHARTREMAEEAGGE